MTETEMGERLRDAFRRGDLVLYLGAGVSVGSGLPTWDQLVLAMYYGALSRENLYAFPNYLFAIAEWNLGRRREPAEITARKIRSRYQDPAGFLSSAPPDAVRRILGALRRRLRAAAGRRAPVGQQDARRRRPFV
jgi:hypothetical protein